MRIKEQLVSSRAKTNGGTNNRTSITVHETANRNRGAGAQAHANLQSNGNVRSASWHYQVDDKEVVQSFPDSVRCWHAGAATGNNSSIAIEICVNADSNYEQALANAAELVAHLRAKYGLGRSAVVQHHNWSGKNCPTILRSRGSKAWQRFVAATGEIRQSDTRTSGDGRVRPATQPERTSAPATRSAASTTCASGRRQSRYPRARALLPCAPSSAGPVWRPFPTTRWLVMMSCRRSLRSSLDMCSWV